MTGTSLRTDHELVAAHIASCRAALSGPFGWDAARQAVTSLREELERHFEREESDGYLQEVLSRAPERAKAAAKLQGDHSRMRGELAKLLATVLVARSRDAAREELETFLAGLADHERREHELVQLALTTDVGTGD